MNKKKRGANKFQHFTLEVDTIIEESINEESFDESHEISGPAQSSGDLIVSSKHSSDRGKKSRLKSSASQAISSF